MKVYCPICQKESEQDEITINGLALPLKGLLCSLQCESQYNKQIESERLKELYNATLSLFPESNKDARLKDYENEDCLSSSGKKENCKDLVKRFSNSKHWFIGFVSKIKGNGKSRLGLVTLSCLAYKGETRKGIDFIKKQHDIGYYKADDINILCRPEINNVNQPNISMFKRCKVLMIDELKEKKEMPFNDSSIIEMIIESRHDNYKRTILTSNLPMHEFVKEYPRLYSRISSGLFELTGPDKRRM